MHQKPKPPGPARKLTALPRSLAGLKGWAPGRRREKGRGIKKRGRRSQREREKEGRKRKGGGEEMENKG